MHTCSCSHTRSQHRDAERSCAPNDGPCLVEGCACGAFAVKSAGVIPCGGIFHGPVSLVPTPDGRAEWIPRDPTSGVYVPTTSTEWENLGIARPTHQWGCEDTEVPITAQIGSPSVSVEHKHSAPIEGWSRKSVGEVAMGSTHEFTVVVTPAWNECKDEAVLSDEEVAAMFTLMDWDPKWS